MATRFMLSTRAPAKVHGKLCRALSGATRTAVGRGLADKVA